MADASVRSALATLPVKVPGFRRTWVRRLLVPHRQSSQCLGHGLSRILPQSHGRQRQVVECCVVRSHMPNAHAAFVLPNVASRG